MWAQEGGCGGRAGKWKMENGECYQLVHEVFGMALVMKFHIFLTFTGYNLRMCLTKHTFLGKNPVELKNLPPQICV